MRRTFSASGGVSIQVESFCHATFIGIWSLQSTHQVIHKHSKIENAETRQSEIKQHIIGILR